MKTSYSTAKRGAKPMAAALSAARLSIVRGHSGVMAPSASWRSSIAATVSGRQGRRRTVAASGCP